ncbi:hypothetical protein N9B79_00385 [bacterium]|nr:hypothetical protein [bacterium]
MLQSPSTIAFELLIPAIAVPDFQSMFVPFLSSISDGEEHAIKNVAIEYDVAVSRSQTFTLKRIDTDYFDEV